ncbi:hypothetical protein T4A_14250 [Trichinella pseudospiralis]|uniref:Uncharacterized protein n=2 Tax=Trichinella pseudospiralis TaxID=6337 RepID=A0A0V1E9G1_TRIPS|nr:hypothetical protein T4A_14250 [Trichinella pseudospiralis]
METFEPITFEQYKKCSKNLLPCAGVHSTEQACRSLISKLLTRWRFVGILHNCFGLSWLKKTDFLFYVSVQVIINTIINLHLKKNIYSNPNLGKNEDREWKSQSMTTIEARSGLMGEASHEARFNITDVICAPSIKCIIAADSFIKGFERDQKGKMKNLNIKIDGGLSESIEGYYLQKQFRSLALERGYAVDEVYEYELKFYKFTFILTLDEFQ